MSLLIRAIECVVIVFMAVVVGIVIAETLLRDILDVTLIVTDELSRYLMVWTAMLSAALLVADDGHIKIEVVLQAVGPRLRRLLYVCAQLVVLAFLGVLVYASLLVMPSIAQQNTVTLGVSIAWFYAALPVTGALMIVLTVHKLVQRLAAPVAAD